MNKPHKLPCEKVIEENIGLVKAIVARFNVSKYDKDDLIQAGLIGLWRAAYNYKEEFNVKFSTYCVKYILGEIKSELKNHNLIKVSRKYYMIINELNKTEHVSIDDICLRLGCYEEDIKIASSLINNIKYVEEEEIVDYTTIEQNDNKENKLFALVKNLKENKHYTQKEIAKRIGKSQSTVSRIINKINQNSKDNNL
mgnify:CR=1 FL=1